MKVSKKTSKLLRILAIVALFASILQMATQPSDGERQRVIGYCQGVAVTNYDQVLGGHTPVLDTVKHAGCIAKYEDSVDAAKLIETDLPEPKSNLLPILKTTIAIVALLII